MQANLLMQNRFVMASALLLGLAGCSPDDAQPEASVPEPSQSLDEFVEWGEPIQLEENDAVVNVLIRASVDPEGGFLVADEQEGQIRRYGPTGRLLTYFGSKGPGPEEFSFLQRAQRLPSGAIVALDTYYRGAVFDSAGATVARTFRTPVGPVHHASVLGDTLLLLGGHIRSDQADARAPRLHVWNLQRDTLSASFFAPVMEGQARQLAANTAGFVGAAARGDTVAAVFSLSDTVYLFRANGRAVGKVPLPFRSFRRLEADAELPDRNGGLVKAREWLGSFSLVSDVFWLSDGSFLVQYQDRKGPEPRWRLLHAGRHGEFRWEVMDSPRLLAVDNRGPVLFFVDPSSPTPDLWRAARLRS